MARLGHARPNRPQALRGWVEFAAAPTEALAGLADGTGTALGPEPDVAARAGGGNYLQIADFGNNFTTPDDPSFQLGTELAVRMYIRMPDWTPAGSRHQFGQASGADGNWSWVYSIHPTGIPRLAVWPAGTSASLIGPEATAALPATDGEWLGVGATVELDIGGDERRFVYEYSLDGLTWVQLGDVITETGATSFFNSTAVLGSPNVFASGCNAYSWVRMWSDAARTTLVAAPDWRDVPLGATSHVDMLGLTWTHGAFTSVAPGAASGTGFVPQARSSVGANAGLAEGTGSGLGATVQAGADTNAQAGVAAGTGSALSATVQIEEGARAVRPVVVGHAGVAARRYRSQSFAAFVDLGPPLVAEATNAAAGLAAGTGGALQPEISVQVHAGLAAGTGTAPGATVQTAAATDAPAGLAAGTGTASGPEPDIQVHAGLAAGTGAALGATVQTAAFANAEAGCATGLGAANPATITIRPLAGVGLAAGVANQPEAEIAVKAGVAAGTGTAQQPTVAFGALAFAGVAAAAGAANTPKIDLEVHAGAAAGTGEAFSVFGLTGNPTGPGEPVTVTDGPSDVTVTDGPSDVVVIR